MLEWNPEPFLHHPLHLRPEPEDEPAARELSEIAGVHRGDGGASRERKRDGRSHADPLGGATHERRRDERGARRLRDPHALEPGLLGATGGGFDPAQVSSDDDPEFHGAEAYDGGGTAGCVATTCRRPRRCGDAPRRPSAC